MNIPAFAKLANETKSLTSCHAHGWNRILASDTEGYNGNAPSMNPGGARVTRIDTHSGACFLAFARLNRSPGDHSDEAEGGFGNGGDDGADERDSARPRHLAGPARCSLSGSRQVETVSLGSVHKGVSQ